VKKLIVVRIIDSVLALMLVLHILEITGFSHFIEQDHHFLWLLHAIYSPLRCAVIPLAQFLAIHMPLSAVIAKCTH